jgi:repressor LexA
MEICERLKKARTDAGLKQNELAEMLGIPVRTYRSYEHGERDIGTALLLNICKTLGVSSDFLLGRDQPADSIEAEPQENIYQIPIYETVAAGFGAYASDSICGYMPLSIATREEAEQTMVIRVRGDSMYPVIPDGSRVQVHRQNYADNGQIVVMLIDGEEGVLKRYYLDDGRGEVRLESYNPTYPPRIFRGADIERLRLVGVAVSVVADLP